jgi:hypothetical protein
MILLGQIIVKNKNIWFVKTYNAEGKVLYSFRKNKTAILQEAYYYMLVTLQSLKLADTNESVEALAYYLKLVEGTN